MKRIEYAELKRMGASEAQLDTYSNSDPLTIYQERNGSYSIRGIIEADNLSADEVLSYLADLGEA